MSTGFESGSIAEKRYPGKTSRLFTKEKAGCILQEHGKTVLSQKGIDDQC